MRAPRHFGSFQDFRRGAGEFALSDMRLEIRDGNTAVFRARLCGPAGAPVWARAWLSTEAGTLAESASGQMSAGDEVVLEVVLRTAEEPQFAYMRIESSPLETEHVVGLRLA